MNSVVSDLALVEQRIAQTDAALPAAELDAAGFSALLPNQTARALPAVNPAKSPVAVDRLIETSARRYGVDPALVRAVIAQESGFDRYATSSAGAQGLMQLMPQTARDLGVTNPYDPAQNIDGGTRLLRILLDRFGNARYAVAAYNAGPEAVEHYGGVPPFAETQQYVASVLQTYAHGRR
ncbi:MAG: lytic transglycosylase domain-containing protein [Vulcanimicrobiaceae bacterium]